MPAMSTVKAKSPMLRWIVDKAAADSFAVPDLQRDFRWGRERIRGLLASVIAGHPIGAVTVLRNLHASSPLSFAPSTSLMSRAELKHSSKAPHVLDGQQRLVALLAGFRGPRAALELKGKDTDWFETRVNAYGWRIDLAHWARLMRMQVVPDSQDASLIEESIKASIRTRNAKPGRNQSLLKQSKAHMKAVRRGKFELPLWYLLRQDGSSPKLAMEYRDFMSAAKKELSSDKDGVFHDIATRLEEVMSYPVPIVMIDSCTTVRAAQMFRRMNQQGMPLSTSDLVCSQISGHDASLRREMRQYQARADKTASLLPLSGIFEEDVLFASLLAGHADSSGIDLHPDRLLSRIESREGVGVVRAGFDRLVSSTDLSAGLLASCGVSSRRKWPIDAISIALLAAVAVHQERFSARETEGVLKQQVRRWWWAEHLRQAALGANGRRPGLLDVFQRLSDFLSAPRAERPNPATLADAGLSDVLRSPRIARVHSPSLVLTALMECALRAGKPRLEDLFSGEEMGPLSEGVDLHHLFPKAWARRSGLGSVDSVLNLTLMGQDSNRNILRDKSPGEQFNALLKHGQSKDSGFTEYDVRTRLKNHGLDVDLFLSGNYEQCCEHRLAWLSERIRLMLL